MKLISFILIASSVFQCSDLNKSIQGKWISEEDTLSTITFNKDSFFEIYNADTIFAGKYIRSSISCDSNYLADIGEKNLDFLQFDSGTCYEITGLSDSILAYRHTSSGKMHVLYKAGSNHKKFR